VWFTEKQATGSTRLYPLLDFNPRRDENVSDAEFAAALGGPTEQEAVSPS
jgi:hypothetical protein